MKKLLAVLLSIMMLAMPLTSMAENSVWDNAARQETTITIHDLNADLVAALGGDDTTMAAINDLLAALSLTGYQQGDEAGFDLNLSGKSVLGMASLTTAAEENQLMYVSSALLGGVIAVNSKDMEAIEEKFLRATMKMSGQSDEEIDKAIEESKEQLSGNAEYTALMEASANLSSMTEEQLMEELTQADTTAFMTLMNEILSGAEMAEVTEQPGDCDAAKSYVKVTVPPEKLASVCSLPTSRRHGSRINRLPKRLDFRPSTRRPMATGCWHAALTAGGRSLRPACGKVQFRTGWPFITMISVRSFRSGLKSCAPSAPKTRCPRSLSTSRRRLRPRRCPACSTTGPSVGTADSQR